MVSGPEKPIQKKIHFSVDEIPHPLVIFFSKHTQIEKILSKRFSVCLLRIHFLVFFSRSD
jgi:hypothetical protein